MSSRRPFEDYLRPQAGYGTIVTVTDEAPMSTGPTLAAAVDAFIHDSQKADAKVAEELLLPVLIEVMARQGFDLERQIRPQPNNATDYMGVARPDGPQRGRVGVEYKHYGRERPVDVHSIDQVAGLARRAELDRALLLSRSGFTNAARRAAAETYPVQVELLTLEDFRALATVDPEPPVVTQIAALVRAVSEEMARLVAQDPRALEHLEWRDLERMMSVVLEGLGFDAELTPGSKDGGKDIILRLNGPSGPRSYIVELKHWRAGKPVGVKAVREFCGVIARERHESGLFLSTSGYANNVTEALTEVERSKVRLGGQQKVVSLCRTYVKTGSRLWQPDDPERLPDMLLGETA